jgi:hypothetical protein
MEDKTKVEFIITGGTEAKLCEKKVKTEEILCFLV